MSKIKEFIKQNKLSFKEGQRNSTVTTLVGYSQHLGLTENKLRAEIVDQIDADSFIDEEVKRLWKYGVSKGYKNYWTTSVARKTWNF